MPSALVRYGSIPEVAQFDAGAMTDLQRNLSVVVQSHRGLQLGTFLEWVKEVHPADRLETPADPPPARPILRRASSDDESMTTRLRQEANAEFPKWAERIVQWDLDLELIDLEWTLDRQKLILYVLNDRGPDCTKLALQAAAAGLGTIEVQPVTAEGLVTLPVETGGCGSCGCG